MESTFGASSTVAATFATVIKVLEDSMLEFKEYSIKIWIRRPGPNYLDRLGKIEAVGWRFGFADGRLSRICFLLFSILLQLDRLQLTAVCCNRRGV